MKKILSLSLLLVLAACGGGNKNAEDEAPPPHPLVGSSWHLTDMGLTPVPSGVTITAVFAEGQVTGRSGCNNYFSACELGEGTITFGPVGGTKMMCPDEIMDWETLYTSFLENAVTYRVKGGNLLVERKDGEILTFAPSKPGT